MIDQQAQIDALRRAVESLAEVAQGVIAEVRRHNHSGAGHGPGMPVLATLARLSGRLDAIRPMLDAQLGPPADGPGHGAEGEGGSARGAAADGEGRT